MKAREGVMSSKIYGDSLKQLYPVVEPNLSDSGAADCVLEFLVMVGQRSLPEVHTRARASTHARTHVDICARSIESSLNENHVVAFRR